MMRLGAFAFAAMFSMLAMAPSAHAHCDGIDGPVATAAQRALETGNVNLALPYAPAEAEAEIIARFAEARRVRSHGRDARLLADRAFVETVVRLHRIGEGASFTGLRPAGVDYGPIIPAADHALETGNLSAIKTMLMEEIEHGLAERLAHAQELRNVAIGPKDHGGVEAARERVHAELGFITYAEGLRQAIAGAATTHHED